jgi:nitrite reductase/ring-hydroxylating ferredoxin subunit
MESPPGQVPDEANPQRPLERVAVLRRTIGASLERIWENVLDWEHLPWLHSDSFEAIELLDEGEWGWRARAELVGERKRIIVTELKLEREARRYVARTIEGTGEGSEIWTSLSPRGPHRTDIEVEFFVPAVAEGLRDALERTYLDLYSRLWDEDEAMMQARQSRLDEKRSQTANAPGVVRVALDSSAALESKRPFCVDTPRGRFRLLRLEGEWVAHSTLCPHMLGPLEGDTDEGIPANEVRCPWHGHRFDVRTGERTNGRAGRLRPAPRVEIDPANGEAALIFDAG